jgi:hypothetical protein
MTCCAFRPEREGAPRSFHGSSTNVQSMEFQLKIAFRVNSPSISGLFRYARRTSLGTRSVPQVYFTSSAPSPLSFPSASNSCNPFLNLLAISAM